jgi:hypothetical protein
MAGLQAAVMDDDALDDELQDGLLVGEGGIVRAPLNALTERAQAGHDLLDLGQQVNTSAFSCASIRPACS